MNRRRTMFDQWMGYSNKRRKVRVLEKKCNKCIHSKNITYDFIDHIIIEYYCTIGKAIECRPHAEALYKNVSIDKIIAHEYGVEIDGFIKEEEIEI